MACQPILRSRRDGRQRQARDEAYPEGRQCQPVRSGLTLQVSPIENEDANIQGTDDSADKPLYLT